MTERGHRIVGSRHGSGDSPRRSCILAGGGMRVAYQAGALKALLDSGLVFDHADGTSGGTMNLAMWFSGLSPDDMIERWLRLDPKQFVSFLPVSEYLQLDGPLALGDADGIVEKVFPHLGIDAEQIRQAKGLSGTFNVCNFTTKTNEVIHHEDMTLAHLVAGISLPIFMPPVRIGTDDYVDSVWIKDANLLEAVRQGAEEIWVVWCIGNSPTYRAGPFHQYVHMIELSANGSLFAELAYIRELNERIRNEDSPFGQSQPIRVHLIRPADPLPLDPAYFSGAIDARTLVARGYADASSCLKTTDLEQALDHTSTRMRPLESSVSMREHWTGTWDSASSSISGASFPGEHFEIEVTLFVHRLPEFLTERPRAEVFGRVNIGGSWSWLSSGEFRSLASGDVRTYTYQLLFSREGRTFSLEVSRRMRGGSPQELLRDLRTLSLTLRAEDNPTGPVLASARVELDHSALSEVALSLRAIEPESVATGASAVMQFGGFFFRDAYAQHLKPKRCWLKFW